MKLRDRRVYQSSSISYLLIAVVIGLLLTTVVQAEPENDGASINYLPGSIYKGFLKYGTTYRGRDENSSWRNVWLKPFSFDSSLSNGIYSLRISQYSDEENDNKGNLLENTSLIFSLGYNKNNTNNNFSGHSDNDDMLFGLARDQYKLLGPLFFMSVDHRW